MGALLVIGLVVLAVDIASNVFYILFGRLVVREWRRRVRVAEDRVKVLAEVVRQMNGDIRTGDGERIMIEL